MEFIHLDIWSYCFLSCPMICISSYQYNELLTYVLVLTFVSGENSHPLNLNIEENLGNLKLLQMVNGVVLHMRNMTISVHHLPRHLILMMVRKIIKQTWIEGVLIFFFSLLLFWIYFHVLNSSLYRLYSHVAIGGDRDLNGIRQKILLKQFQIMMQTTIVMMI